MILGFGCVMPAFGHAATLFALAIKEDVRANVHRMHCFEDDYLDELENLAEAAIHYYVWMGHTLVEDKTCCLLADLMVESKFMIVGHPPLSCPVVKMPAKSPYELDNSSSRCMNAMRSCPASEWSMLVLQYDKACFCLDFLRNILKSPGNILDPETSNSLDVVLAQAQGQFFDAQMMMRGCATVAVSAELRGSAHSNLTGHSFYVSSPESAEQD